MFSTVKLTIKRALAFFGLYHPALGIKISPQAKAEAILQYKTPALKIFVETGTEFGTMINLIGEKFEKIYSIELDKDLFEKAQENYKDTKKIHLLNGDSAVQIQLVLQELHEPAIFWLDAHGPGNMTIENPSHCPVEKELKAIFGHTIKKHVIIIDDARMFDLDSISKIRNLSEENGYVCKIEDGLFKIS